MRAAAWQMTEGIQSVGAEEGEEGGREGRRGGSVSLYIQTLAKFRRPRPENCQFKVSLGVIVRPCQKTKKP